MQNEKDKALSHLEGASTLLGIAPEKLPAAWARGSDAPEIEDIRVGFVPLTDCAPIAVAAELGLDRKYGIRIVPSREASWAAIRDKVITGELHAAQMLYGMVYGVEMGLGGVQENMAILMTLNRNGQGITLSNKFRQMGATNGLALKKALDDSDQPCTFAHTFPTGTHAAWLYYWLAAYGIHPLDDIRTITVPPPQMVAGMRMGNMDGYCAGEPWNAKAVSEQIGFTVATSQDIWRDHPEKVIGTTATFADRYPNAARALVMALLEACRYLDHAANRTSAIRLIAGPEYLDMPEQLIQERFIGQYQDGLGKTWQDPHALRFFNDGEVNFPYLSDGIWFLTQHKRWGMLEQHPDYLGIASRVHRIGLYTEAAQQLNVPTPSSALRSSTLIDGTVWDGLQPAAYADGFRMQARSATPINLVHRNS